MKCVKEPWFSMMCADAERRDEITASNLEGRDRKSRDDGLVASSITADRGYSGTKAEERLMELVVSRENMMAAHRRVFIDAIEGVIASDGRIAPEEYESFRIFQDLVG